MTSWRILKEGYVYAIKHILRTNKVVKNVLF